MQETPIKKKRWRIITIIIALIILTLTIGFIYRCAKTDLYPHGYEGQIMRLSISSDGQYAVSTDMSQHVVLWNLRKHTTKIIAKNANIYSAYFIKNSDKFIYQDNKTNKVFVKDTHNQNIETFEPNFPSYGEVVTTDLKTYIGADEDYQFFLIKKGQPQKQFTYAYCNQLDPTPPKGALTVCDGFITSAKVATLDLLNNDQQLLSIYTGHYYIFDTQSGELITKQTQEKKNGGFANITYSAISPDEKYLIGSDTYSFLFNLQNGNIPQLPQFYNQKIGKQFCDEGHELDSGWCPIELADEAQAIKFIDKTHYLVVYYSGRIGTNSTFHHVGLFSLDSPNIIKYLSLLPKDTVNTYWRTRAKWQGKILPQDRYPAIYQFIKNGAVDTSPSTHTLVFGQTNDNGILLYHYNPKTQTLKLDWVGNIDVNKRNIFARTKTWWLNSSEY